MTISRKDHKCTLCRGIITKGMDYYFERFTPWDCPENDVFWVLKAHRECNTSFRHWLSEGDISIWNENDIDEWRNIALRDKDKKCELQGIDEYAKYIDKESWEKCNNGYTHINNH
jgi:hypothetical protein